MLIYHLDGGEYDGRIIKVFGKSDLIKIPRKIGALTEIGGHYVYSVNESVANFLGFYTENDLKLLEAESTIVEYEFISDELIR